MKEANQIDDTQDQDQIDDTQDQDQDQIEDSQGGGAEGSETAEGSIPHI